MFYLSYLQVRMDFLPFAPLVLRCGAVMCCYTSFAPLVLKTLPLL